MPPRDTRVEALLLGRGGVLSALGDGGLLGLLLLEQLVRAVGAPAKEAGEAHQDGAAAPDAHLPGRHAVGHLGAGGKAIDKDALASIAREVNVYDSVVETGNEALDTILTEKSLACSNEDIVLSCIADGAALDFMSPSDIHSFFGNALDNAIEAVRQVSDPERRNITLNVARRGKMVAVSIENFYELIPRFQDGLSTTTKANKASHGFGVKSMQATCARYNGMLHMGAKDGVFYLNALLADPQAQ